VSAASPTNIRSPPPAYFGSASDSAPRPISRGASAGSVAASSVSLTMQGDKGVFYIVFRRYMPVDHSSVLPSSSTAHLPPPGLASPSPHFTPSVEQNNLHQYPDPQPPSRVANRSWRWWYRFKNAVEEQLESARDFVDPYDDPHAVPLSDFTVREGGTVRHFTQVVDK